MDLSDPKTLTHLTHKLPPSFRNGAGGYKVLLERRDIGTAVRPKAKLQFFLTATLQERARRHLKSLPAKGKQVPYEDVLTRIVDRDRHDRNRAVTPLVPATDAIVLDTTHVNREHVVIRIVEQAQREL